MSNPQTTDLHKDWGDLAAYVEAGSPIGRPAALEIFYRLRTAYDKPDPQTAKDARELALLARSGHATVKMSGYIIGTNEIQAALTAAEQRGFERGKADAVMDISSKAHNEILRACLINDEPNHWRSAAHNILLATNRSIALIGFERAQQWQPIDTAPTTDKDFFLVGCDDPVDTRHPFVVRGDILAGVRQNNIPKHLSLRYLTHWMPLREKPRREETDPHELLQDSEPKE